MVELIGSIREHKEKVSPGVETVLVMQGGGSLGAYECGIYKALAKNSIKFDIVSGTSIGAINAAIIASHSYRNDAVKDATKQLENFWLELAEPFLPSPKEYLSPYFTDELTAQIGQCILPPTATQKPSFQYGRQQCSEE